MTTPELVLGAMRGVIDPELGDDLVDLGMYQGCEIAGFSVPRMLGMEGRLEASRAGASERPRIEPMTKQVGAGLIKVVSMGFLSPEDEAIMWRGLMLLRGVQHFLEEVAWGDVDYLL